MAILKRIAAAALLLFTVSVAQATEQIAIDGFGYLNSDEAPSIIGQMEAQDLLNVELSHSGKSVKKRSGYGTYKTLSGSQAVHGGIHFFDSSGNDVQVWASSTSLFGIIADGSVSTLISSATLNATWDCADTQGFAYCVNTSRDALIKTNGATITWLGAPLGTMVAVTPERLLVAGVASAPNTIYYSAANNFTNFTVGVNAQDSSTEQIAAPGSKITNIDYACGRWLWWKDLSFGYVLGTDQTNLEIRIISPNIGTQDNSDAIDPDGNVYFRGQDGHVYKYDCNSITRLTTNITPAIQTSGRRTAAFWTQSLQSDFAAGTSSPTVNHLSTSISPNNVVVSSFTLLDNAAATFNLGTFNNTQLTASGVALSTSNTNVTDNSFEGSSWGNGGGSGWVVTNGFNTDNCGSKSAQDGTHAATYQQTGAFSVAASIVDANSGASYGSTSTAYASNSCTWTQRTISVSGAARKYCRLKLTTGANIFQSATFLASGANVTYYTYSDNIGTANIFDVDFFQAGVSTVTTGAFISRTFDTNTNFNVAAMTPTYTVDGAAPTLLLQTSRNNLTWTDLTTSTATNNSLGLRYIRYVSSFSATGTQNAGTVLSTMAVVAVSSGTYLSNTRSAPNLTAWDVLQKNDSSNDGTLSYFMRASTNTFTISSSTPAWTAVTAGAVPSISTGTTFQVRVDFGVSVTTQNPVLNDFTVNWFEGSASDKAYAIYFEKAIWWTMAYGNGQATNNYIFRYDISNDGWTLYNFGTGGFLIQNNALYFGSPSAASVFRYGDSTSDNGTAINAYWQSKDFAGSDPFLENSYTQLDTLAVRNQNQTLTVAYTLNASTTSTSYSVSLSSATDSTIRHKKLLPAGKIGGFVNVKFSDTSATSAWEVLGFRMKFDPLVYRPTQ